MGYDDALHTYFSCNAWNHSRIRLEDKIGVGMSPDNLVASMLHSRENWIAVRDFAKHIISHKESEERRRQLQEAAV